jgi:uncharacterized protein (DUF2236 family)
MLWDSAGELRFALVLPSALIMQVAHPAIGAAVAEHSVYQTDPFGRLTRSLTSVMKWVYGGPGALTEGQRLRDLHKTIKGTDDRGRGYHALAAGPYAWVALSAFDRAVAAYRLFYDTPLTPDQEASLYGEVLNLSRILQVPERMLPPTVGDYRGYVDDLLQNTLEDHPTVHDVLAAIKSPVAPPFLPLALRRLCAPAGITTASLLHFIVLGTLPAAFRDKFGLAWSAADERRFHWLCHLIRRTVPRLPERARYLPIAYQARQIARQQIRLDHELQKIDAFRRGRNLCPPSTKQIG